MQRYILSFAISCLFLAGCIKSSKEKNSNNNSNPLKPDGSVLPFPPAASASIAGESLAESKHTRREQPKYLQKKATKDEVKRTVPAAFTASETFDVGIDLGSPVSLRYHKKAPFKFNGKINKVKVELL